MSPWDSWETADAVGTYSANNALIAAEILNSDGAQVAGETCPLGLSNVPSSNCKYQGLVKSTAFYVGGGACVANIAVMLAAVWRVIGRYPVESLGVNHD